MKKHFLIIPTLFLCIAAHAQWTSQATGFSAASVGVRDVCAIDANTVWIATYDGSGASAIIQNYSRTTDGGNTWIPGVVPAPADYAFSNIAAVDGNTAWACFYKHPSGGGGIWKTTDAGTTWAQQGVGSIYNVSSFPNFVHFFNANNGFTAGDPNGNPTGVTFYEIYTTTNGGTTWTRTPSANIPAKLSAGEFGTVNVYCTFGNTIWFGTNQGRMYKSPDGGLNWTVTVVAGITEGVADVEFRDSQNGIVTLYNAGTTIFSHKVSSDGGATWTALTATSGTMHNGDIESIGTAFVSTGAATGDEGSSYSVDNGANWLDIDLGVQHTTQGWVDGSTGWAGGFSADPTTGGIYKYSGVTIGVKALNNDYARMRMFPNPSNGQFTLQIGGAETKDAVVKIVDVVGNTIYMDNIGNKSTVIEEKIDISAVSKGVYFVTVENGTTRFVNKITIK